MSFLSRIMGLVSEGPRTRQVRPAAGRRRSPIDLETLEGRALLSGISGVSVTAYGTLVIEPARNSSGNTATVSIDPSNHFVKVALNGKSEEFNPASTPIYNVYYVGGQLGHDTFADNTSLESRIVGYGTGNNFTGGTTLNYVYFDPYGGVAGGNTYTAQGAGSCSDVFEIGGTDTINNPNGATIQVYYYP